MLIRKITVTLLDSWMEKGGKRSLFPIHYIREYFINKYGFSCVPAVAGMGILVVKNLKTELTDDEIKEDLEQFIQKRFKEPSINVLESVEIEEDTQAPSNEEVEEEDEDDDADRKDPSFSSLDELAKMLRGQGNDQEQTGNQRDEMKIKMAIEGCENLIGGKQFKKLCAEMVQIAPKLTTDSLRPVFKNQSYLFAINDGCGFTTAAECFAKLLFELGLSATDYYRHFSIAPKRGEETNMFDDVLYFVEGHNRDCGVASIDMSNWMSDVTDTLFKNFLKRLSQSLDNVIVVFRIPFIDNAVLMDIISALNDVMYVRPVVFPPLNNAEIHDYARRVLSEYGFSITNRAWEYFDERILLERADGRFYGMNTIKKVVGELVYKKQLDNAIKKRDNTIISARDAKKIIGDNPVNDLSGEQILNGLIGGETIKKRIYEIVSQIELSMREEGVKKPCMHMRFIGNPGTGKTTVARAIGKLLREKGVLRVGGFFEYHGRNFCGRFIGETAPKTASICRDAYGSVLFIDEAYSLYTTSRATADYGKEAIDTLISEMENHRTDLLVIMAGYPDEMQTLMTANAGLESRMPHLIEFPNFTRDELFEIYKNMLRKSFQYTDDLLEACKEYFDNLPNEVLNSKSFSNARFVRNLFERTWAKASTRSTLEGSEKVVLSASDFKLAISDKEFDFNERKKNRMGFI